MSRQRDKRKKLRQRSKGRHTEAYQAELRQKLVQAREARNEVQALFVDLVNRGVTVPRESLSTMAAVEALTDLLVDAGVIERTDVNLHRFLNLKQYLTELDKNHPPEDDVES